MKDNKVLDGLMGLCIGDALGVPVEFETRRERKADPVKDMTGYGTNYKPPGTWSDDSSLTFCLADSLCRGYSLEDMANRFVRWLYEGYWTPDGRSFGVGAITKRAIDRLKEGVRPVEAGGKGEWDNGNGSLMRILPMTFYLSRVDQLHRIKTVHHVSCLTHAHLRSQMSCGIYVELAVELLKGKNPDDANHAVVHGARGFYASGKYKSELRHFSRILDGSLKNLPESEVRSGGYVIDTLEASIWCLLNSRSYEETVLKAVNLGEDTDTTAAAAGGLAGIVYGFFDIPDRWVQQIARRDDIIRLAEALDKAVRK